MVVHEHGQGHFDVDVRHERVGEDEDGQHNPARLHLVLADALLEELEDQMWPQEHVLLQLDLLEHDDFAEVGVLGQLVLVRVLV